MCWSCGVARYFQCVPTFGLFAPMSKVARVASSLSARRGSGSVSRIPVGTSLALTRDRSGSQESLSSVGSQSVTSNVSRSRLRLGVTSLAGQVGGRNTPSCHVHNLSVSQMHRWPVVKFYASGFYWTFLVTVIYLEFQHWICYFSTRMMWYVCTKKQWKLLFHWKSYDICVTLSVFLLGLTVSRVSVLLSWLTSWLTEVNLHE